MKPSNMVDPLRAIAIAQQAGAAIMNIYEQAFTVEYKPDGTPITEADRIANQIITAGLSNQFPGIPILSEEHQLSPYEERKNWKTFWLVDPLDGTKEFVNKNDEFTVNIAFVSQRTPIFGIVYAPAMDLLYYTANDGAFRLGPNSITTSLPIRKLNHRSQIVIVSRSHHNASTTAYLQTLQGCYDVMVLGSSLKLCFVAEGTADLYPRCGPTMEWDIAAGHAIVNKVGKHVYQLDTYNEVIYNKRDLTNPWFVVK
jgi:3'(2'), 5'-bisphosphate nucleotidase